jgi:hypothetical protein
MSTVQRLRLLRRAKPMSNGARGWARAHEETPDEVASNEELMFA